MPQAKPMTRPDIDQAMLDPMSVFATPEAVVDHPALTRSEKVEILQRWEYDASEIAVAAEEGMTAPEEASDAEEPLLRRITLALQELAGPLDLDRSGASKQQGLARGTVKPGD